ncbi:uncharacterized protein DUF1992 [Murinocardiopsis flavida]|uniref:Uncharacterized protein DUF1992 n=1 Tax=Murinocardiopsis flavida TaxID=645275 RepID=A0A2P8CYZ8_9ACTN|nr:DUF1992 domain-containing protein [Murinocardiopsis flavida]PSK90189.1 uncharacterized protein DUF1992 [Murinocardiopsis flavida]
MTERKPPGVEFETWVDKQIREATERGEFDGLSGAGKPIPDIDRPRDDMWWVKKKLREENVSLLPPTLALRKEAEEAHAEAMGARTEAAVRRIVTEINAKITAMNARPPAGPPLNRMPFDPERVVTQWREHREGTEGE